MNIMNKLKPSYLLSCLTVAVLGYVNPAFAANTPPDAVLNFSANTACSFPVTVEIWSGNQIVKEFKDKNGNLVRSISAGKGSQLRFTNDDNQETFLLESNGSVLHTTYNADGSLTDSATGHNVIILFPTDHPAGPTTTLYEGEVVYRVDPGEVFTFLKESGNQTDICAAIS